MDFLREEDVHMTSIIDKITSKQVYSQGSREIMFKMDIDPRRCTIDESQDKLGGKLMLLLQ